MSHDVNDHRPRTSGRRDIPRQRSNERTQPYLLSRITRNLNSLALNSFGSLFSGPSPFRYQVETENENERAAAAYTRDLYPPERNVTLGFCDNLRKNGDDQVWQDNNDASSDQGFSRSSMLKDLTPTPTRATTPNYNLNAAQTRFPEVKRLLNRFAGSATPTASITVSGDPLASFYGLDAHYQGKERDLTHAEFLEPTMTTMTFAAAADPAYSANAHATSDLETPPLTPDSLNEHTFLSSASSNDSDNELSVEILLYPTEEDNEDTGGLYPPQYTQEIKEGKKPERDICYETLIQDIPSAEDPLSNQDLNTPMEDKDEWYGLEYTLELSSRERHPSDTQSFSAGEHSKSRESWALIHRGTIHPFFEDEDYHQWKNWHRYLDRQDERRKHKKGFEFKTRAKDLAWFFADEMRTRDVMYWQKEVYNAVGREVKDRLNYLAAHRPDPYYPRKKHDLGWYLKHSRSVACLRELMPIPVPEA
ncbi:uncharacterized protein LACBIDRAFT_303794 [Laccaria bicolor S238N-H82]|uniref:Predicted protein n=1 Tax=Laccaria bicolor (strain S238N-H82 / ATCC MYA-4686) TaxID=486041 RepID=B0DKC0_LACBS|nr:uncharacterized protein LACBIDRAFT_303794 [Laccaria bicolor S238N-H82]EDR04915.1 predicted protein [Laccaria bicolor S238N-H82]|eukprot:XP_001884305.1 predicted protein [Laccaria bicolor S238N-H82]